MARCSACGGQEADNLAMTQGVTFEVDLLYSEADGSPVPLAGLRGRMQVRAGIGSPVLLDLSTENGGITLEPDGRLGVIRLFARASQTRVVTDKAVYDLHLIDVADPDRVTRPFGGTLRVTPGVTQSGATA